MESGWTVSKLSTESVGSRCELVANCVHTADADATKQFRRVGVGGVYWALTTVTPMPLPCRDRGCLEPGTRGHHNATMAMALAIVFLGVPLMARCGHSTLTYR